MEKTVIELFKLWHNEPRLNFDFSEFKIKVKKTNDDYKKSRAGISGRK